MEIVTKAMFRLPAQIHFCYGMSRLNPDWFLVWTAKTHMKAISANQIHTTFGGHCDTQWWHQIQRDRCSLDWETTHRTVRRQSLSNKLLAPQLHNMNVGKVQEHATNHTGRLVLSGHKTQSDLLQITCGISLFQMWFEKPIGFLYSLNIAKVTEIQSIPITIVTHSLGLVVASRREGRWRDADWNYIMHGNKLLYIALVDISLFLPEDQRNSAVWCCVHFCVTYYQFECVFHCMISIFNSLCHKVLIYICTTQCAELVRIV